MGGASTTRGDPEVALAAAQAFDVAPGNEARDHVHGFHSYPARMHPVTAGRLVEHFSIAGNTVLDPFCGSGTVAVESVLRGRAAVGVDLNPLGIELGRAKTTIQTPEYAEALLAAAETVVVFAEERRARRAAPTRRYSDQDRQHFAPHVLLELDNLRAGIEQQRDKRVRMDLSLVLSSLLTKVSMNAGDTTPRTEPKRIGAGFTTRWFMEKTRELVAQRSEFAERLGGRPVKARFYTDDARRLLRVSDVSVDLVVSSPPYAGVYDYYYQHERRLRWLGLDGREFRASEIGSRRELSKLNAQAARTAWENDVKAMLKVIARVLKPGAHAALVVADTVLRRQSLAADLVLETQCRGLPLEFLAAASQARPYFHDGSAEAAREKPRREHLVVLRKAKRGPAT